MLPPYCSLINSNDFNEANISFCYFTFFFLFFFSCCQIYNGLDPCNSWMAPVGEDPRGKNEHLFQSSTVVVGHLELQLKMKL